jgi:hypothetical protein
MITLRTLATIAAMVAIAMSTSGCGALLVGYLVGDAMQKSKATETCRANVATANQARITKGESPIPDQCGQ